MKNVKKLLTKLILLIAIVFVAYTYFFYSDDDIILSPGQEEIIANLGRPEQFSLTYLPKGSDEGSEFQRHELWFYPSLERKITFFGGKLVATEELEIDEGVVYEATQFHSEDFGFYTSLGDVEKRIGKDKLAAMELPGFFDEGVETYASAEAMFIFENGYLTYMETLD